MNRWIVKTDPTAYAYADLEREGRTVWDGVTNALARIHLRAMREGDFVLVFHTGNEQAVVGIARVVAGPRVPYGSALDADAVVVDLCAVARAAPPVPKAALAASCHDLALFTKARLSVLPVPVGIFDNILKMAGFLPDGPDAITRAPMHDRAVGETRIALAERIYVSRFGVGISTTIGRSGVDSLDALVSLAFRAADAFLERAAKEQPS